MQPPLHLFERRRNLTAAGLRPLLRLVVLSLPPGYAAGNCGLRPREGPVCTGLSRPPNFLTKPQAFVLVRGRPWSLAGQSPAGRTAPRPGDGSRFSAISPRERSRTTQAVSAAPLGIPLLSLARFSGIGRCGEGCR